MEVDFVGDIPSHRDDVIFASCDEKYFYDHAPALIASCCHSENSLHIHIVNPSDEVWADTVIFKEKAEVINPNISLTISGEVNNSELLKENPRTYYACNRFIMLPTFLQQFKRMLVVDIDCFLMKHIDFDTFENADIGIFLREPLPNMGLQTSVAAGAFYASVKGMAFAESLSQTLLRSNMDWFVDQIALWQLYQHFKDNKEIKFMDLGAFRDHDKSFMDWEFVEGSTIWTGKGPRKYENTIYVNKKNELTDNLLKSDIFKPKQYIGERNKK